MSNTNSFLIAASAALLLAGTGNAVADDHDVDPPAAPELPAPAAADARDSSRLPEASAAGLDRAAEATIRLMDAADADLPADLLNDLPLPDLPAVSRGNPGSAGPGAGTPADNASSSAPGLEVVEGLHENARENANEMAGEARERIENRGRSDEFVPTEPPGRPDSPPGRP